MRTPSDRRRIGLLLALLVSLSFPVLSGVPVAADASGAASGTPRRNAASISAGDSHTCVLDTASTIRCWGNDDRGQLGNGLGNGSPVPSPGSPTNLPAGRIATSIVVGGDVGGVTGEQRGANGCVVHDDRTITCWGSDDSGQIGDGPSGANIDAPTTVIATNEPIASISVGALFVCALSTSGSISCWGFDGSGQLGNGDGMTDEVDTATNARVVALPGGERATAVSAGGSHVCALLQSGGVSCWGDNSRGQLGIGAPVDRLTNPSATLALPDGARAVGISAGVSHTCAVLETGGLSCWGDDASGQLGNGAATGARGAPEPPIRLASGNAISVAAGGAHTCALTASDTYCWGSDSNGQIGNGAATGDVTSPVLVRGRSLAVALGASHTCALAIDRSVQCWGKNEFGQLGVGDFDDRNTPTTIGGLTAFQPTAPPGSPDGVTATGGRLSADVSWNRPDDGGSPITSYLIEVSSDDGATWSQIATAGASSTSASISPLSGGLVRFRVTAVNDVGTSPSSAPSAAVRVLPTIDVATIDPIRVIDTRAAGSTIDGQFQRGGRIEANQTIEVPVAGRGVIPSSAGGAVVNVTIVDPESGGFATVYPCTPDLPNTASVNFLRSENTPNVSISKLSGNGSICVFVTARTHVLVDVTGYLPDSSSIETFVPKRFMDTRSSPTIDGQNSGNGPFEAGQAVEVQIAGRPGVPADAGAVFVNVTAIRPSDLGFVTLYPTPCDTPPLVSNLNHRAGVTTNAGGVVELSSTGSLCVYSSTKANMTLDVSGYLPATAGLDSSLADRLLDTRVGTTTVDGGAAGGGRVGAGQVIEVKVAGRGGTPDGALYAALNVTAVQPGAKGFATVYPCTATVPTTSTINYEPFQNVQNLAITKLSASGTVCIFTSIGAHFIVDARGFNL